MIPNHLDPKATIDFHQLSTTSGTSSGIHLASLGKIDLAIKELKQSVSLTDEADNQRLLSAKGSYLFVSVRYVLGRLLWFAGRTKEALNYSHPLGIAFGPDGNLYVGSRTLNCVLRYDGRTGGFLGEFAKGGGLAPPHGLAFGDDGNLYVSSEYSDCILRYDGATGEFIDVFVSNIPHPVGLVFGPDGNLFVSSWSTGQIIRYDNSNGKLIDVFVQPGSGGLIYPAGLVFGPNGDLFVASQRGGNKVLRYNGKTGQFKGVFASRKRLAPSYLTFGPDHNLYVSSLNLAVTCYDGTTGKLIRSFSRAPIRCHLGLAFGPDDNLYVAEDNINSVLRYGSLWLPGRPGCSEQPGRPGFSVSDVLRRYNHIGVREILLMNRVLCFLHAGCNCNQSRHLRWLKRLERTVERIKDAADLECGFDIYTPDLYQLIEGSKDRSVRLCFWRDGDGIDDLENLPSITAELMRNYAKNLLSAADRIDASGSGVPK